MDDRPATADVYGAQRHARTQAGATVQSMPVLPPAATDLPEGVDARDILWEETIAPGGYAARRLRRGSRLRLIDLAGDASASLLLFNADHPAERLNIADTVKVQWNAYLGAGKLLLSDMGRVLASIVADDTAGHDAFCGASNRASNALLYGGGDNHGAHPNARDRLFLAAARHGLARRDIHPCLNLFKPTRIAGDGAITLDAGPFAPGRSVILRVEMDILVLLANCPHRLDGRTDYSVTPLRATAWRGAPAGEDDPIRNATPEALRAFLNTDDLYRR